MEERADKLLIQQNDEGKHIVLSIEPHMVIVHCSAIGVDDLVNLGRLLGVVE